MVDDAELDIERVPLDGSNLDNFIIQHVKDMSNGETSDKFFIQFECIPASEEQKVNEVLDWSLCGTDSSRKAILKESTFALILAPSNTSFLSTALMQARLYEALRSGAIPVILGGDRIALSYKEVVAWRRVAIFLPKVCSYFFVLLSKYVEIVNVGSICFRLESQKCISSCEPCRTTIC